LSPRAAAADPQAHDHERREGEPEEAEIADDLRGLTGAPEEHTEDDRRGQADRQEQQRIPRVEGVKPGDQAQQEGGWDHEEQGDEEVGHGVAEGIHAGRCGHADGIPEFLEMAGVEYAGAHAANRGVAQSD